MASIPTAASISAPPSSSPRRVRRLRARSARPRQVGGRRFYVDDIAEYTSDLGHVIRLAKAREPGLPVFLLGHSAGGVVSCTYALDHQRELAGLVCESFAFKVPAPDFVLAIIKGLSCLAPGLPVLTLKMKDFTRDPDALRALDADPLTKERCSRPRPWRPWCAPTSG